MSTVEVSICGIKARMYSCGLKWRSVQYGSCLGFSMLAYFILKYPLKCAPAFLASVDVSATNDDRLLLLLQKYVAWADDSVASEYTYIEKKLVTEVTCSMVEVDCAQQNDGFTVGSCIYPTLHHTVVW